MSRPLRIECTLGEACRRLALEVHAYCLMPNPYHLLVRNPRSQPEPGDADAVKDPRHTLARLAFELGGVWQWKPPSLFDYPQWADET